MINDYGNLLIQVLKSVAQEPGFYNNDVEQQLNELVEKPANKVLDKLRNQERITETDRIHLGVYIATMLKRVPKRRTEAYSMIPSVFDKTITKVRTQIQEWGQTAQNKELFERKLLELEAAEKKLRMKHQIFLLSKFVNRGQMKK